MLKTFGIPSHRFTLSTLLRDSPRPISSKRFVASFAEGAAYRMAPETEAFEGAVPNSLNKST